MLKRLLRVYAARSGRACENRRQSWVLAATLLLAAALILAVWPVTAQSAPPAYGPIVHTVQWGENLTSIAARYGVDLYEIASANRLSDPNRIYVGQRLVIPLSPTPEASPPANSVQHVVLSGDTLSALAVSYGTTVDAIVQANGLVNPSSIYVGQVLFIPAGAPPALANCQSYTVQPGDTLAGVAFRHGVSYWAIAQVNNLCNPSLTYPGQALCIPGGAEPAPSQAIPVDSWVGIVVSNPPGAQFDDYFENLDGARYGVDSSDANLQGQLAAVRDTGRIVQVWGTMQRNVPDVNGARIDVSRMQEPESEPAEAWTGRLVKLPPGEPFDDYLERDDSTRYGVGSTDAAIREQIAHHRLTGEQVRIWGSQLLQVADYYGTQVQITRIEVIGQPAESRPVPSATSFAAGCPPPPLPAATPLPDGTCVVPTATPIPWGPVPLQTPAPPKPLHMDSPEYGMNIDIWGMNDRIMDRDLRLVKGAGFTWVKQPFKWRDIEAQKGVFDWKEADRIVSMANKYNLDLAIAVSHSPEWASDAYPLNGPPRNMADFAEFMGALAKRYRGLVRAYEIWPGPNVSENWGGQSPDHKRYAEMLIVGYWYVKNQDPYAMIISGGLVQTAKHDGSSVPPLNYFRSLYTETKAARNCDVWGVDALGYLVPPETPPEAVASPELNNHFPATAQQNHVWCFRSIEELHHYTMAPERPYKKQFVVTRMGWTNDPRERSYYHWAAVPEKQKADYLRRAYRWASENWNNWVGVMFVPLGSARWTMDDDAYWWATVNSDGCTRPSYDVLRNMPK